MSLRASSLAIILSVPAILLTACHSSMPSSAASGSNNAAEQRAQIESQREQIALIPPASKNRFMTVHTFDSWENPSITVQTSMLTIHVLQADANTSTYGAGGILRPIGARREQVNIAPGKLAEAMASIPESSWPYGRVIAIEEAHKTPASAEPAVRRNLEATVATLSNLGIAAYDINDGRLQ